MVYHEGELAVQRRAGVADLASRVGRIISDRIPPAAAAFLEARTFLIAATIDAGGRVWASALEGEAGFARAVDERTVLVAPSVSEGPGGSGGTEIFVPPLRPGPSLTLGVTDIGLLAIDFATRRRMRINGTATIANGVITVRTREVYSNCPQYIREHPTPEDTFFIATAHPTAGADVSHRGGGFTWESESRISWPDLPGNNMFNTLGNLTVNPSCGLLFLDGTQITGRASIVWEPERRVVVDVHSTRNKNPLRYSPSGQ